MKLGGVSMSFTIAWDPENNDRQKLWVKYHWDSATDFRGARIYSLTSKFRLHGHRDIWVKDLKVFQGGREVSWVGLSHVTPMSPVLNKTEIPGNQTLKGGASCSTTPIVKERKIIFESAKRAKRKKSQYVIIIITVCNWHMLPLLLLFAIFMLVVVVAESELYSCW